MMAVSALANPTHRITIPDRLALLLVQLVRIHSCRSGEAASWSQLITIRDIDIRQFIWSF